MTANVVDRENVRMVQRGNRARFLLESASPFGVVGKIKRQHLDRDVAFQAAVSRSLDLAHATGANGCENFVRPSRVPEEMLISAAVYLATQAPPRQVLERKRLAVGRDGGQNDRVTGFAGKGTPENHSAAVI